MNKVIVVEGKTDISFLKYLFKEMNYSVNIEENSCKWDPIQIAENLYISNLEGCNGESKVVLKENFENLEERPEKFGKIIYFLDADKDYLKVKNMIEGLKSEKVSYYIFPNNRDIGMLEDLLLKIASKKSLVDLIELEILSKLKDNKESKIKKEAKSKMMIYLAANTPLKESLKDALQAKNLWDFKSEYLTEIKEFLKAELEIT